MENTKKTDKKKKKGIYHRRRIMAVWRVQIRFGIKHVHTGGVHLWQLNNGASVPVEEGSPYMGLMLLAV